MHHQPGPLGDLRGKTVGRLLAASYPPEADLDEKQILLGAIYFRIPDNSADEDVSNHECLPPVYVVVFPENAASSFILGEPLTCAIFIEVEPGPRVFQRQRLKVAAYELAHTDGITANNADLH